MNKAELESKHLSELHTLAAEAGVERYRMLSRAELIEKLADNGGGSGAAPAGGGRSEPRQRRERQSRGGRDRQQRGGRGRGERRPQKPQQPERAERPAEASLPEPRAEEAKPRRRRRRRFRRRGGKTVRVHELLQPAVPGRQAIVYGESREGCTALLREMAAELSKGRGPDPVALLVDPGPEELADWKREAPKAEIVSAGQERHAEDAVAQAERRAADGESVVLLIDSLSRMAEAFGGSNTAKDLFNAGLTTGGVGGGSLTVVAAVERPS